MPILIRNDVIQRDHAVQEWNDAFNTKGFTAFNKVLVDRTSFLGFSL
jgi:hypothetical protein